LYGRTYPNSKKKYRGHPNEEDVQGEREDEEVLEVDKDETWQRSDVSSEETRKGVDFLVAMRAESGVNRANLKTVIISETKGLLEYGFDSTVQKLREAGFSPANVFIQKLKREVCGVFDDLKSSRKQEKLINQQYNTIKPKFVQLCSVLVRHSGKKRKTKIVPSR